MIEYDLYTKITLIISAKIIYKYVKLKIKRD